MKKTVRMVHLAEQEMLDAAAYYEDRVNGLGRDFLDSIALAVKDSAISRNTGPLSGERFEAALYPVSHTRCSIVSILRR